MRNRVKQFLERHVPSWQVKRYVLAISGGVDSMVLLHQFLELFPLEKRKRLLVVHIHHHLRVESDEEEVLIREFCQVVDVAYRCYHWEESRSDSSAVEVRAREFRYACFEQAMVEFGAEAVVLAHHGDDQVETMLMKWTRGTTLEGGAGMRAVRVFATGVLLRPFLGVEKESLYRYASSKGIPFSEDASNASLAYTRNRYRHQVVPLLKQENPRVVAHFQEMSQMLLDTLSLVEPLVVEAFERIFTMEGQGWSWQKSHFLRESPQMQRLLLVELAKRVHQELSTKNTLAMYQLLVSDRAASSLDLSGGWRLVQSYDNVRLVKAPIIMPASPSRDEVFLMTEGTLSLQLSETESLVKGSRDEDGFVFEVEKEDFPLTIRHRQTGDRLVINAQGQHQSIKRWCMNEKIPLDKRDRLWLVETKSKKIIAILGYRQPLSLSKRKETGKIVLIYKK